MTSLIAETLSRNQTLHWCVAHNWIYGHFVWLFTYFGQNLVAIATSVRPLQSEMSYLDWSTLLVAQHNLVDMAQEYNNVCSRSTENKLSINIHKTTETRMWANAQRDGRPAERRWRPLFNAAKSGWRSLLDCRAVTLPRRKSSWN